MLHLPPTSSVYKTPPTITVSYPLPRAQRPPHLLRSRREEDEGRASQGRRNQNPTRNAAARGHGTEGLPSYP